jgi:hypothetical protein
MKTPGFSLVLFLLTATLAPMAHAWEPAEVTLMTPWAADVDPANTLPEYPRPQLVREDWQNLNGLWDYAIANRRTDEAPAWEGEILVPFPVESALSGVKRTLDIDERLWYRRAFTVPTDWRDQQILLHFGAVDWECEVWVNGHSVGTHRGGYDAFSFDITRALNDSGEQQVTVAVWDPTDDGYQPRGKQVRDPQGIWYTPVTGIWQTVWLEPVVAVSLQDVKLTPDIDAGTLSVDAALRGGGAGVTLEAVASLEGKEVAGIQGPAAAGLTLEIPDAELWSPEAPTLYDLELRLTRDGQVIDTVQSYFGMRKIAVAKDEDGINRLFLNNEPLFQYGPLDQGWWPDGLYTAPTDEALRYDVEVTKQMGFNMIRKHVKVEPARWYYHCDQLGMLVWQDMPNGDAHIGRADPDIDRVAQSRENFYREYEALIDVLYSHPSIVMWVPFNEGWGQFETTEVTEWTRRKDPTRLVNQASGWTDRNGGDVHDMHRYPGPGMPPVEEDRAVVLGEFGGLGLPVEGHLWWNKRNWGYCNLTEVDDLRTQYAALITALRPLIGQGLAAAVYTQTTDVEGEVNGLLTYDRKVLKMGAEWLGMTNAQVYLPPPKTEDLASTSEATPQTWRYLMDRPDGDWENPDFDDSHWQSAAAPFGTEGTPGIEINTPWDGRDIYLRRQFELKKVPEGTVYLRIHHDDDAWVYLNGVLIARQKGYQTAYTLLPLDEDARKALRAGTNTLAVHCRQAGGGQCIDAGIVAVTEQDVP